jgi:glycosyltransferase involved in cell wall biosynthesis
MDAARRPLVSVIVPSFNQGRFLRATLDSILSQDYRPLEVLVADGASKDDSVDVLKEYAAKYPELQWWSEPDRGPHDAVNKGLAQAKGEITGIQSSDDLYLPGAISAAVAAFEQRPELGLVYGQACFIDARGESFGTPTRWVPFSFEDFFIFRTYTMQSATFFRTELGRALGGWRADYYAMDTDFWMRMIFRAPALMIDRQVCAYRFHEAQRDHQVRKIWESHWRMVDDSPELKRAPWRVRLAARAGRRIITERYNPRPGSIWFLRRQLWLGLLLYPPAYKVLAKPATLWPGFGRLRELLGAARSVA